MATKLKNLQLTSVDLVRSGANQEADICLFKSAEAPGAPETPTEPEKNIFKQFINWLRKNPQEAEIEALNPVTKAEDTAEIYKSAITESIQSIMADDDLTPEEKSDMMAKSLSQYHAKMAEISKSEPEIRLVERFDTLEEVEKFNPYHDARGRFASANGATSFTYAPGKSKAHDNAIAGERTRHASESTIANGGISIHVKSGKEPKDGYMCAVYGDRSKWLKGSDVTDPAKRTAAIKDFMAKNDDVLSDPDNYLGTWFDTSTGMVSLDISRNFTDKNEAIKFASSHNEKAIWDVANMVDIPTGGTGNNL